MKTSVFSNREFTDGFIQFCDSVEYQKYMTPFLDEMIENTRDILEKTTEPVKLQNHLAILRRIKDQRDMLVSMKFADVNSK